MNTRFLVSCTALTLLGLGGAAFPVDAQARGLSFGANAGRSVIPFASRKTSAVTDWSGPSERAAGAFLGPNAGRGAGHPPGKSKQQTLGPDSLLKTTNAGAIGLTEHPPVRNFTDQNKGAKHF